MRLLAAAVVENTDTGGGGSFITTLPGVLLSVLGIIAVLAGAVGFARGSFAKAQITALRGDRDDLAARLTTVEADRTKLQADLKEEKARREALELVVTGKQELQQVISILNVHDGRAARVEHTIDQIATKLGADHE